MSRAEATTAEQLSTLNRRALLLSYLTVTYNLVEGLVAVAAGISAGSYSLIGFSVDSFIESLSGMVMIWRFTGAETRTAEQLERVESRASQFVGISFLLLAVYVGYESAASLIRAEQPEPSIWGIAIAIVSLIVMPLLFRLKYKVGRELGSRSLVADSKQTLMCMLLSATLLLGLGLNYAFGLWWADPLSALLIAALLVREGVITLKERELCDC